MKRKLLPQAGHISKRKGKRVHISWLDARTCFHLWPKNARPSFASANIWLHMGGVHWPTNAQEFLQLIALSKSASLLARKRICNRSRLNSLRGQRPYHCEKMIWPFVYIWTAVHWCIVTRNEKKTNKLSFQFHAHKNKSTTFSLISNNLLSVEMKKMNLISSSYSRCRVRERKNLQLLRSIDAVLLNQISVVLSKNGPIVRH